VPAAVGAGQMADRIELGLRVGINSGEVIVGDVATPERFTPEPRGTMPRGLSTTARTATSDAATRDCLSAAQIASTATGSFSLWSARSP